jgi:hypothetical protein
MKFRELPVHLRPTSEAGGNTRIAAGMSPDRNLIASVIERWRSSTMTQKHAFDDDTGELGSWRDESAAAVPSPPAAPPPPSYPPPRPSAEPNRLGLDSARLGGGVEPNRPTLDPQRPSILRKPLSAEPPPQNAPTRWR